MILVDLTGTNGIGSGALAEKALESVGLIVNKNTVPGERSTPFYPSGIRIGTPAVTTRGMKEKEMAIIAEAIIKVLMILGKISLPKQKMARKAFIADAENKFRKSAKLNKIKSELRKLAMQFATDNGAK
jgi:glycine hydroxymethyltransferase